MARIEDLDPVMADVADRVRAALAAAGLPDADPAFERPRDPSHGDWATTLGLRLAKDARMAPRAIAEQVVEHLDLPDEVEAIEVAGPGFLNLRLSDRYRAGLLGRVLELGADYGRRERPAAERRTINGEFVSANPTGPLHVGAGRWVATGDAIAALLEADGHTVDREYYLNDAGAQVRTFGDTLLTVARGLERKPEHYKGGYVEELVAEIRDDLGDRAFQPSAVDDAMTGIRRADMPSTRAEDGGDSPRTIDGPDTVGDSPSGDPPSGDPAIADDDDARGPHEAAEVAIADADEALVERLGRLAVRRQTQQIRDLLRRMGVEFDTWFSEASLHASGAVEAALDDLVAKGVTYEADGALFLRTTDAGDDKDRVLRRSNGVPTYFAADCAYMRDKWERGYTHLLYLLGADHHGYVKRLQAVGAALGIPADALEILIGQMVSVTRDGEAVKMSKRAGTFVPLDEVVDEVGADVARYHFLRVGLDTTQEFDLVKVAEESNDNPVHYIQYAHARIASILKKADAAGFDPGDAADVDVALLDHEAEQDLFRGIAALPETVAVAAELRATQRLAHYVEDLAAQFNRFYASCRILGEDVAPELARARYWLAVAAKQCFVNALTILRVTIPDRVDFEEPDQ